MRVAIVGNPNAGKTTLFNLLTGMHARVGNYPGTTVEARTGGVHWAGRAFDVWDLPGCYSLQAEHGEESVVMRALTGLDAPQSAPLPDVVVALVDSDLMARSLYLVLQLAELNLPMVVAINTLGRPSAHGLRAVVGGEGWPGAAPTPTPAATQPSDALLATLGEAVAAQVVRISARDGAGVPELMRAVVAAGGAPAGAAAAAPLRLPAYLNLPEPQQAAVRQLHAGLLAARGERGSTVVPAPSLGVCLALLTARALGRHLSAAVRAAAAGPRAAWAGPQGAGLRQHLIAARFAEIDRWQPGGRLGGAGARPGWALDRLLLHPLAGSLVLLLALAATFQLVFVAAAPGLEASAAGVGVLARGVGQLVPAGLTQDMLCFGVLAGVANVLAFVPQIALLFAALTLYEESGYMARVALLLDTLMRRLGLQGRAFMPLMTSFGCAVPGILATRTLESPRQRLATMLVAPWMGCSARLPIYTMVVGAFFAHRPPIAGFLAPGACLIVAMYLLGVAAAAAALLLMRGRRGGAPPAALLLELPPLRLPQLRDVALRVWVQSRAFVAQTGALIVIISVVLWGLMSVPRSVRGAEVVAARAAQAEALPGGARAAAQARWRAEDRAWQLEHSLAGRLGHAVEPALAPLGFDWRIGVALIASFAAREVLVSTLAQIYAIDSGAPGEGEPGLALSAALRRGGEQGLTPLTGAGLMVFFALALQCSSTVAVVRRETGGWRWPVAQLVAMNTLAYLCTLAVVQGGRALGWR